MDAASDSVTKVVYREGIGSSIECGDQVTILYSGMWSSNEGADFGIQSVTSHAKSHVFELFFSSNEAKVLPHHWRMHRVTLHWQR